MPTPQQEIIITGVIEKEKVYVRKQNIPGREVKFSNIEPASSGRHGLQDIVDNTPGLSSMAKENVHTELDAFGLFFTSEMFDDITTYTNERVEDARDKNPRVRKYKWSMPVSKADMMAVVGFMYLRGLKGQALESLDRLFSDDEFSTFAAIMSKNRFKWILKSLGFEPLAEKRKRTVNRSHDYFTAIRQLFERFQEKFAEPLIPSQYLTIDECLYPMRHVVKFRVYNPSKPAKYGMLFKCLNSAEYPYTYQAHVYASTPASTPTSHYVKGTESYVHYMIDKVQSKGSEYSMAGCNISYDRLYTSISLARWFLAKRITTIGTWMNNKKGYPQYLKDNPKGEKFSSSIWYQIEDDETTLPASLRNQIRLVSYVIQKSTTSGPKLKNLVMMTTTKPLRGITIDDKKTKPALFKTYDFSKGGTDIVDQRMGCKYSTKAKTNKWTNVAFYYLLDCTRVNTQTVWSLVKNVDPRETNSYAFGKALAKSLYLPAILERSVQGLQPSVLQCCYAATKDPKFLGRIASDRSMGLSELLPPMKANKGTCRQCLVGCYGADYTINKNKLSHVKTQCQKCGLRLCLKKHLTALCKECAP